MDGPSGDPMLVRCSIGYVASMRKTADHLNLISMIVVLLSTQSANT